MTEQDYRGIIRVLSESIVDDGSVTALDVTIDLFRFPDSEVVLGYTAKDLIEYVRSAGATDLPRRILNDLQEAI